MHSNDFSLTRESLNANSLLKDVNIVIQNLLIHLYNMLRSALTKKNNCSYFLLIIEFLPILAYKLHVIKKMPSINKDRTKRIIERII